MATERTGLKQKIATLKRGLALDFAELMKTKVPSPWFALSIIRRIESLVNLQELINATYVAPDERVILERVAKRRKIAAAKGK